MVQKKTSASPGDDTAAATGTAKRRGRPRAFAPDEALGQALAVFRDGGFAATSLDDLSAAMGINRPSLYGAFGDKRALFLKAYARYRADAATLFAPVFAPELTLNEALQRLFSTAIAFYTAGAHGPQGCFTVMTAGSEAMADPEIRGAVQAALASTDRALGKLFEAAQGRGELAADADLPALVRLTAAAIHSIAVRARARAPAGELEAIGRGIVALVEAAAPRR
jgi:AcrR family transcriptional regulator